MDKYKSLMWKTTFESRRIREEIRLKYTSGDCEVDELRKELALIREKEYPFWLDLAKDIADDIIKAMYVGFRSGPHWEGVDIEAWLKTNTAYHHELELREASEDDIHFDDYPVVDFYVKYDPVRAWPTLNINKLFASFDRVNIRADFGVSQLSLIGEYEGAFVHVNIHMDKLDCTKEKT